MQSPLQVTIMATLLEDTGEPPQQRYRLFAEYYRTIYKRETRRKLLGGILTERQKDIDTIHTHAGLMLQVTGEKTTGKRTRTSTDDIDSALSDDQFRELVRRRLEQIGISAAKVSELLDSISDGSLQRLVFLVRPRVGWVQFDITSLKEFMAAEAIMNGSDDDVRERLKVIAPANPNGRRGLLPIIAGFAAAGCRCTLPKHVLDLAKSWSPRAKDDAIGLCLAGEDLYEVEVIALADEISKSDSLDTAVWRALNMASASSLKQAARFALALLALLADSSEREADAAGNARRILTEFMTNRPSLLQNPSVWQGLHLPERL